MLLRNTESGDLSDRWVKEGRAGWCSICIQTAAADPEDTEGGGGFRGGNKVNSLHTKPLLTHHAGVGAPPGAGGSISHAARSPGESQLRRSDAAARCCCCCCAMSDSPSSSSLLLYTKKGDQIYIYTKKKKKKTFCGHTRRSERKSARQSRRLQMRDIRILPLQPIQLSLKASQRPMRFVLKQRSLQERSCGRS